MADTLYARLDHIAEEVAATRVDLARLGEKLDHVITHGVDHEARLRKIETWTKRLPVATLAALVAAVSSVVVALIRS